MKVYLSQVLLLALLSPCLSAPAEETSPLDKSKAVYAESLQKIETDYQARLKPLTDAYYKSLIKLLGKAKVDGNLEALVAIKAEEERFLKEKTVPSKPPSDLHALIVKTQTGYNNAVLDAGIERDKQILSLLSQYMKRLEALKVAYVRKEDITNATAVDKVLDGAKKKYQLVQITLRKAGVTSKRTTGHKEFSSPLGFRPGQHTMVDLGKGVKLELVWIPPGTFHMGSPDNEEGRKRNHEGPLHHVTITKGFWMGKYEVTQEQWKQVMGNNPSRYKGDRNPVENVKWNDCQKFLTKLNTKIYGADYRLPTEAEWEYACRAGTSTRYYTGNSESDLAKAGWYLDNKSKMNSRAVGQKKPNKWGLYDMHGNVHEWCLDWYGAYSSESVTNPIGPSSGLNRILRGGTMYNDGSYCRSAYRNWRDLSYYSFSTGFRLARTARP